MSKKKDTPEDKILEDHFIALNSKIHAIGVKIDKDANTELLMTLFEVLKQDKNRFPDILARVKRDESLIKAFTDFALLVNYAKAECQLTEDFINNMKDKDFGKHNELSKKYGVFMSAQKNGAEYSKYSECLDLLVQKVLNEVIPINDQKNQTSPQTPDQTSPQTPGKIKGPR